MLPPLLPGLYDLIVTDFLAAGLAALDPATARTEIEPLDRGDSHAALAEHVRQTLRAALHAQAGPDAISHQIDLCNRLLHLLESHPGATGRRVAPAGRRLRAVWDPRRTLAPPPRPDTPLGLGCLLTGTRRDPSLVSQLKKELASADQVDILCSFIKWSGIRILEEELQAFTARPDARLRVVTTSYLGATDQKAVDFLEALPQTAVRVSYDTHRTRLHAKAYLFHRDTGFGTAYIGSANLSQAALTDGLEWSVKVSQYESPHLWERVVGTFETYWEDPEFTPYTAADRPRLALALEQERVGGSTAEESYLFDLRPYSFQEEILDRLEAERRIQGRDRHLVVAATGTGKTMIAAFDYRRWCRDATEGGGARPRLLFVAHREELLQQSLRTFRAVLRDPNFGDLLVGGREPATRDHLFVSIQSYNSRELHRLPPDHYAYVVVDEFHHAAAPSYNVLLGHARPRVLLGLTATPERADNLDVLGHFGGHLSAQIRLPDAINRKLLCPFQYFGVSDVVDLHTLRWQRGGYRLDELDQIYTGNDARAALVADKVRSILLDPRQARGLGFCVSVAHANFMADRFRQLGLPAESLSGESDREHRRTVQDRLRKREINFLFVVDLYNEGVDIPEVDTVLFLRPTESLTVFLQQLGRGLRLDDGKDCLTVLDFIGQAHRNFRFDLRYRALLTDPALTLDDEIEEGFAHLPAGCTVQLERIARQHVLENIRQALRHNRPGLVRALREQAAAIGRAPTLAELLENASIELDDLYRRGVSWSRLRVEADLLPHFIDPDETMLTRGLRRLQHITGANQIGILLGLLEDSVKPPQDETAARLLLMLDLSLWGRDRLPASPADSLERLRANPTLRAELRELLAYKRDCIDSVAPALALPFPCPLTLHALYTRDEILAALGHWTRHEQKEMREGVVHLPAIQADALLFTLDKTEKDYSPTTMYQDYAINEHLFHWQSQSTTAADSPTGRRYIEHENRGQTILLFGRERGKINNLAQPYYFLGPARYVSHSGSRPMSIVWRLEHPLPAAILRRMARLVAG